MNRGGPATCADSERCRLRPSCSSSGPSLDKSPESRVYLDGGQQDCSVRADRLFPLERLIVLDRLVRLDRLIPLERVIRHEPLGRGVHPLDVLLERALLDPPLPATADLDSRKITAAHERVGLSGRDVEDLGDVGKREEPLAHPWIPPVAIVCASLPRIAVGPCPQALNLWRNRPECRRGTARYPAAVTACYMTHTHREGRVRCSTSRRHRRPDYGSRAG